MGNQTWLFQSCVPFMDRRVGNVLTPCLYPGHRPALGRPFLGPIYAQLEHMWAQEWAMSLTEAGTSRERRDASRLSTSARFRELPMPALDYTDAVARETAHLYEHVKAVIP